MRRRLLNLLTSLSLLAAVAVAAAWARGHFTGDALLYVTGGTSRAEQTMWALTSGGGGLALVAFHGSGSDIKSADDGEPPDFHWRTTPPRYAAAPGWPGDSFFNRAGFYAFNMPTNSYGGQVGLYGVVVPAWFVFLAALTLPVGRGVAWLVRRRHVPGTCRRCGYDLRASPGRCPECGTTVTTSP